MLKRVRDHTRAHDYTPLCAMITLYCWDATSTPSCRTSLEPAIHCHHLHKQPEPAHKE